MKKCNVLACCLTFILALPLGAAAHVSVKPGDIGVGTYQTFTVGVPVEKHLATTGVRLLIPEGLTSVMPNAKPGWQIELKHAEAGAAAKDTERPRKRVSEIIWSGGSIPAGLRDDFLFSAKAPAAESTLLWRAYQQYADGSEVAWDRDPKEPPAKKADGRADFSAFGPYSQSKVVNDLKKSEPASQWPLWISLAALLVSVATLLLAWFTRLRPGPVR